MRYVAWAVAGIVFCSGALLLLNANMHKELSHDEHMYVAAGTLIAEGLVPYRDFPYLQMPYLPFAYALLPEYEQHYLLTARLFSTLCGWLLLGLIFAEGWRIFEGRNTALRTVVALGGPLLVAANPIFNYTGGLAWNHDLPVLLAVGAFLLHLRAFASCSGMSQPAPAPLRAAFAGGALLGLAVGTRLSFAALLPLFVVALSFFPPGATVRQRLVAVLSHLLGFGAALLPALALFAAAPTRFLFNNVDYHTLNTGYWLAQGYERAMTLPGKVAYLGEVVREPGTLALMLALLATTATLAFGAGRGSERKYLFELALSLGSAAILVAAALAPTPTWYQYFYAPVPFLALGLIYALASSPEQPRLFALRLALFGAAVSFAIFQVVPTYGLLEGRLSTDAWTPLETHRAGEEIRDATAGGTILTLSPLFALEGGAAIYPQLAAGPFAWRSAPLLTEVQRRELGLVSAQELPLLLSNKRPSAILVGQEGALDNPLVEYARENGYQERKLRDNLTLWVP
jgi:hypothetical protein